MTVGHLRVTRGNHRLNIGQFRSPYRSILVGKGYLIAYGHRSVMVEYCIGGVIGQFLMLLDMLVKPGGILQMQLFQINQSELVK